MRYLPSRRLAALVAVAGAAFLAGTTLALWLDSILLVCVAIDAAALHRSTLPRIRRSAPARISLGTSAAVEVLVSSDQAALTTQAAGASDRTPPTSVARRIVWTDDLGPGLEREGSDPLEVRVTPGRAATLAYRVRAVERGRSYLGDVHLRVLGPLGLLWRTHREPRRDDIIIQPGLQELRRNRLLALHHRRDAGSRRVRELGEGREFERLRDYVRGDDPRRIDWKATARRAEPIVRDYAAERSQSIVLAIDAGRLMSERFGDRERLDHALAAALVLADAASVHGDLVGALLFADRIQAFVPPARMPLARLADALGQVQALPVEPDYPAAFQYLGRHLQRRSLIVLFTDVIDTRASAALLAHLRASTRKHLPLIVAIRNVELEAAALTRVAAEAEAFHRAAAEELLQARAVALAGVRRQGVLVADVRPDAVVSETLERYLDVKRRGLL
jgi:uncharacterized protein (DUF58 family)